MHSGVISYLTKCVHGDSFQMHGDQIGTIIAIMYGSAETSEKLKVDNILMRKYRLPDNCESFDAHRHTGYKCWFKSTTTKVTRQANKQTADVDQK